MAQSQLLDETKNIEVLGFGASYIRDLMVATPVWHQAITWTNDDHLLSNGPPRKNSSEIWIKYDNLYSKKLI